MGEGEMATKVETNASVINQIKPRHSLETLAIIGKWKYFRHIGKRLDVWIDRQQLKKGKTADKMDR
jgi:hypothetical protein